MHVVIRHYKTNVPLDDALIDRVRNEFVPILKSVDGFNSYRILNTGQNELATISVFETAAGAEESVEKAAQWISENMADLVSGPPTVAVGRVTTRVTSASETRTGTTRTRSAARRAHVRGWRALRRWCCRATRSFDGTR